MVRVRLKLELGGTGGEHPDLRGFEVIHIEVQVQLFRSRSCSAISPCACTVTSCTRSLLPATVAALDLTPDSVVWVAFGAAELSVYPL